MFNLPLSKAIGITQPAAGDWKLTTLGWIFTLAIVFLGLSAAFAGRWLEEAGPRKVGVVSACCWGGGFLLSALGVHIHQIWLIYIGYGVIGGCGLGLGYVSPVSTLIKWFPDRREFCCEFLGTFARSSATDLPHRWPEHRGSTTWCRNCPS